MTRATTRPPAVLPPPEERRGLRRARSLSEGQLARALDVTTATIRSWEAGRTAPRGRKLEAYLALLQPPAPAPEPGPGPGAVASGPRPEPAGEPGRAPDGPAGAATRPPGPAEEPTTGGTWARVRRHLKPGGKTGAGTGSAPAPATHPAPAPAPPPEPALAPAPGTAGAPATGHGEDRDKPEEKTGQAVGTAPKPVTSAQTGKTTKNANLAKTTKPGPGTAERDRTRPGPKTRTGAQAKARAKTRTGAKAPAKTATKDRTGTEAEGRTGTGTKTKTGTETRIGTGTGSGSGTGMGTGTGTRTGRGSRAGTGADPGAGTGGAPAGRTTPPAPHSRSATEKAPPPAGNARPADGGGPHPAVGKGSHPAGGKGSHPADGDGSRPAPGRPGGRWGQAPRLSPAEAFDSLYGFAAPGLAQQAYLLTGRLALSSESVEYAFHRAWEQWPKVAVDRDPVGWVRAAVHDHALSPWHRLRRAHRHCDLPVEEKAADVLRAALLELPPAHRRALLLYDGLRLRLPDTAAETEASTPATGHRVLNARAAVAKRVPELTDADLLCHRLEILLTSGPTLSLAPPAVVRGGSEQRVRRWTRAAIGLTTVIVGATALTLVTAPDHYRPPLAPGEPVSGAPVLSGPQKLTPRDEALRKRLAGEPAGPSRLIPDTR